MKDYYEILGVNKNTSQNEIKKAFRVLAKKYHPDKKGGDENKFKEINEAYQVLSNKEKKEQYDKYGSAFNGAQGGSGNAYQGFNNAGGSSSGFGFGSNYGDINFDFDLDDILGSFFGGGGRAKRSEKKGLDIQVLIDVSLEDAFNGFVKKISFKTLVKCEVCDGAGYDKSAGTVVCKICNGAGKIREQRRTIFGNVVQVMECKKCFGTGKSPNKICDTCKGDGRIIGNKTVEINVNSGAYDEQVIKINGGGESGARGERSGDLYVKIHIVPNRDFKIEGDNLVLSKEIKVSDIINGKDITVKHINGKLIKVNIPLGYDLRKDLIVKGEGMLRRTQSIGFSRNKRGDLIIRLHPIMPKKQSNKARELADELSKELEKNE